jgi:peptide/nickel transport system substrate-binding protein
MEHNQRFLRMIVAFVVLFALTVPCLAQFGAEMVYYELNKPKRNLMPISMDDILVIRMDELMFDALYSWDDQGNPFPQMAQGMPTLLGDTTSAQVILKSDMLWPDSTPVTIDDIIFTFTLTRTYLDLKDNRRALELVSDVTSGDAPNSVLFKFKRKVLHPERLLANVFILPKAKLTTRKALDVFAEKPIGTGPFQLKDISISSSSYKFYKNENYGTIAPGRPYIDHVKLNYWNSRAIWVVNILQGGIVDVLPDMEYNTELMTKPQIDAKPVNTNTVAMILFNMRDPIFKNLSVRQGMQYLIDRNKIYDTQYSGDSTNVLTGPYPPSSWFFNRTVPSWSYDPELGRSLLEKSGLLTFDGKKMIRKDTGKQWQVTLSTYITAIGEEDNLRNSLESINEYLKSSGIASTIEYRSTEAYSRALDKGDFEIIYLQFTLDDNFNIEPFFSTAASMRSGGQNFGAYSNLEADRAFRELLLATVPQKQRVEGLALHKILHDNPPAMFLWYLRKYAYLRAELQNASVEPFYFFSTVDKWIKKTE